MTNSAAVTHIVTSGDTAEALRSGDLPVLGTPRLLAWCEEATCAALDLDPGSTSVGTRIEIEHLVASAVGSTVTATATVTHTDGRLHRFEVVAHDAGDRVLAHGTVTRVVVDGARFMARVARVGD